MEKKMSSALWANNLIGYRKNLKTIVGKPDFSWSKHKVAVFCDSSFWHGYQWGRKLNSKSFKVNKSYWIKKIQRNIERGKAVNRLLKKSGWTVLRFWDFQIEKDLNKCVKLISIVLEGKHNYLTI